MVKSSDDVGENRGRPPEHQHACHRFEVAETDPALTQMDVASARGGVEIERIEHGVRHVMGQTHKKIKSCPYHCAEKVTYQENRDDADDH